MHVLHGTWVPDLKQGILWGEDTGIARKSVRGAGRGKRSKEAVGHPFALSTDHLLRYLDRFSAGSEPDGTEVRILLPGASKSVQPSPEALAAGMPSVDGDLELLIWKINTLTLQADDFLDLLVELPVGDAPHPGLMLGSDLRFWQQAALLAMNCLIEQRYIPALEQQGSRTLAYWQPRPDAELADHFAELMPMLCRAVADSADDALPPRALLDDFLLAAVDGFIRQEYEPTRKAVTPWLKALTEDSTNVLSGSTRDQAKLYAQWQQWQHGGGTALAEGTFRVCFRLEEPIQREEEDPEETKPKKRAKAEEPRWILRYMLQASDDPSLLVDAAAVWTTKGHTLTYLTRRFDEPQEKLLTALGVASRLFSPIERSLREASPIGVLLTPDEAYQFLAEGAALLEQNRFGVLVPNWWAQRAARLKAKVQVKSKAETPSGLLGKDLLAQYQWQLSLGGQTISRREFEELVALKQPLVRFRGEWVALDPAQVESALKFLDKQPTEGEIGLLDALKLTTPEANAVPGAAVEAKTGELEIEAVEIQGVLADLLEQLRHPEQTDAPAIPEGLHATLRPYQQRGFGWLVQMHRLGLGACLADDMGLGKTITAITFWLYVRQRLGIEQPILLICPTSVVGNWRHELNRFAPSLRVHTHQGASRQRGEDFGKAIAGADVVLTSYSLLHRDLDTLKTIPWFSVTLDEAQNIKNPQTKQAQAARAIPADHRLALTGTPVENRLSELWSILQFLNPGYLGSQDGFRTRFALPIERYADKNASAALKKLTTPLILRRVKTDPKVINDLPEKFENKIYCSLTPEQATLYEAVVREEMEEVENADSAMARRGSVLRMLTRLKQICNHPAHFLKEGEALGVEALRGRSGKLSRLTEMLDEVYSADDHALIFTQYAEMGKHLQAYLSEMFNDSIPFLYGDTPAAKREEMVRQFQAPNGARVFILSLKAGGTGLNLTHANNVFHFDRWYNPAVENQATDRAFRIGQTRNVQVHKFICLGTLEERIDDLIEHKRGIADSIVGEGEGWISEMSTDELRDLVALRREMVQEAE